MADEGTAANRVDGFVSGSVVQAKSVGAVHFHADRRTVVPAQLPLPAAAVRCREEELRRLDSYRRGAEQLPLVILSGQAGVGKTTLALHWLHRLRAEYPDGQLYADLGAFDPSGPTAPDTILQWFLAALGIPPDEVPETVDERQALFRSITVDRAIAVLLDNAVSARQARALLPAGSRGLVVVTSRWKLSGLADRGRYFEVDPLSPADSAEVLAGLVGADRVDAEPDAARELAAACAGLPLALSLVGRRLRTRPKRSLGREALALRPRPALLRASTEEVSLARIFDDSVVRLSVAGKEVYRFGGLHPGGGFDEDVVADCLAAEPADEGLAELLDGNLLSEDSAGRFRFHDLLREHAAEYASNTLPAERHERSRREIVEWYLANTAKADAVLHPYRWRIGRYYAEDPFPHRSFRDKAEATAWLELEQSAIRHALFEADRAGWAELVWQFCEALWGFFLHHRHYQDWIEIQRLGIAAAQQSGHRLAEARLRSQLGYAFGKLGRHQEAIAENEVAFQLGSAENHEPTMATALSELGQAARGTGDLVGALEHYRTAARIQQDAGIPRGVALCRRRAGEVLVALGRTAEAVTELRAAAEMMAELADPVQHARALSALAPLYARSGRAEAGRELLSEALSEVRSTGSSHYTAEVLFAFGEFELAEGSRASARRHLVEAGELYAANHDPRANVVADRLSALDGP